MQENTKQVIVKMTARRCFRTEPIYQYDVGHVLTFEGFELPATFEVHFSLSPMGKSIPQVGRNGVCVLPDMYTQSAGVIYAWLYIADTDTGLTKYSIEIPVAKRAKPTNQEPTPVEQSAIDQAIAALNAGVEAVEDAQEAAEAAQTGAESYAESAGQSAITATNAANSAVSAKTAAETAARNAATSATDAHTSREAADQSATNAGISERAAASSASAAAGSATSAAASAGQASASATAASGSASTASTKAGEAAQSATAAAGSAASASEDAGTASTAATAAEASATAAAGSATAAAGSATSAGQSATAAAGSAQTAQDVLDSIPADYSELSEDVNSLKSAINDIEGSLILQEVETSFYVRNYITGTSVIMPLPAGAYRFDFYANQIYVKDENDTIKRTQWNPVTTFSFALNDGDYIQFKVVTDSASPNYYNPDTAIVYRIDVDGNYADADMPITGEVLLDSTVDDSKLANDYEKRVKNEVCAAKVYSNRNAVVTVNVSDRKVVDVSMEIGTANNYAQTAVAVNSERGTISFSVPKTVISEQSYNGLSYGFLTYRTNSIAEVNLVNLLSADRNLFINGIRRYELSGSYILIDESEDSEYRYATIRFDFRSVISANDYIKGGVVFIIQPNLKSPFSMSLQIKNLVFTSNDSAKIPYGTYGIGRTDTGYNGKRSIHFGDSITWYDKQVATDRTVIKGYTAYIDEYLGMIGTNSGVSGQRMAVNGVNTIIDIADYTGYDLVTIAHGTNDYKLNTQLGELGSKDDTTFDTSKFYGAYRKAIEHILTSNPLAKIILFTPLQRDNDGYSIYTTNTVGLKLSDYRQAILNIAEMYDLPVYDAYKCSGITTRNLTETTYDGLHPNNTGHKLFGESAAGYIAAGCGSTPSSSSNASGEIEQLTNAVSDLTDRVNTLSDDVDALSSLPNAVSSLSERVTSVENGLNGLSTLPNTVSSLSGRIDTLTSEVDNLNDGGLQLKDSVIRAQVDTWLANHPDATTTVQDGSLTAAKFSASALKDIVGINAKVFGAKGDGITNDSVILQSLIDQLYTDGGGKLYLPKGIYVLNTELKWKPNVSIVGDGVGATILKPVYSGATGGLHLSAIGFNASEFGNSKETAFTNCLFKDFEIDGSGVVSTDSMYSVSIKGIYMQYLINCRFENLYIHDTIATGLGVDYIDKTVIDGVMVRNCGRGYGVYGGGSLGGAGIGIGSGYLESENSIVTNCVADGCGSNGIFYEHQKLFDANGQEYDAKGIIITNCVCKNNRYNGIGLRGGDTVIITDCIVYDNKTGIHLNTLSASNVRIVNCDSRDNTDADLLCTIDIDGLTILDSLFGTVAFTNVYEENVLQNVTISNNRFLDGCKIKFPKCINFVFSGNTMGDSSEYHISMGGRGDITNENIRIIGNIFGESNSGGQFNVANGANIRLAKAVSVGMIANNIFKAHTALPATLYVVVGHQNTQSNNVHLYGNRAFGNAITAGFTNCIDCSLDGIVKP